MGRYTFRLPDIGEGIAEAEIVAWHVKVGDTVEEDGRIADMMTDKATVEMESPVSGKVLEVAGETGDVIAIGSSLVVIEVEGDGNERDGPAKTPAAATPPAKAEELPKADVPATAPEPMQAPEPITRSEPVRTEPAKPAAASTKAQIPHAPPGHARVMASPAVRKRGADLGIDLGEIRPAEDGRIRHADLDAFLAYNSAGGFQPAGIKGQDEQVRVIGLRRRIAENMTASKRKIPHFAYVEEYDVTALEEMRAQLNEGRGERPKLTMLPFLISAICKLIPKFPMLNAHYDDEAGVVTRYGSVHLGMAAQTPAGLMVPVIRDAQNRNLWQLATEIARLAQTARDGSAKSAELSGSTITITSLGPMGGVATTPVINRPEVAIIGPNRIVERPMFVRDASGSERVEKRKLMNISMSCDHRVVDGWDAASFAQELKKLIEAPALILAGEY
ncbi:dihydrolipoamide acetyltransferase component of pyruvate dehydrogenase complex [Novosphingobium endophyticum]|uniref:Dihydrolipoamide acetyltransferase component of pyruvate dehydrogenase complex n=1 Tax=Novosphingobium endophyticum TaxID=1955250 RepID=A0A916TQT3_9SPHN|nr:dihydrolipoamide acetyltransferase family protein [Novosphingobium endophyticum]GGB94929.1 dihydrolipoamide acetyltransferase component of pyruvate dehydrogenase complex [Novosphingobium endophyticum]